jgi:hypothetical protein
MGRTASGELIGPYDTVAELDAELADANAQSGYTACACRDCMDVSISNRIDTPELCLLCKGAGCEPNNGECQRDDAYGATEAEPEPEAQWCRYCDSPITLAADGAWEDASGACGCGRGEHEPGPPLRDVYGSDVTPNEDRDPNWMNP